MAIRKIVNSQTLPAIGGTINIPVSDIDSIYLFTGSGTLSGNITIAPTGTPTLGDSVEMVIQSSFTIGANTISVFGVNLNSLSGSYTKVTCYYNGSSWNVNVIPYYNANTPIKTILIEDANVTEAKIANNAVTTDKIKDSNVTAIKLAKDAVEEDRIKDKAVTSQKLSTDVATECITFNASFESGEQLSIPLVIPYDGYLKSITYIVTKAIAGTDDAYIESAISGTPTVPSLITIPASSTLAFAAKTSITGSNGFGTSDTLEIKTSKVTPGGKALIILEILRK